MKKHYRYVLLLILPLAPFFLSGQIAENFPEQVLKFESVSHFGADGFGLYDYGDETYKVFDWNFRLKNRVPMKKGEGPGELKSKSARACVIGDLLFINPYSDTFIEVFDLTGPRYLRRLKTGRRAELFRTSRNELLLCNKLFLENPRKGQRPEAACVINPETGAETKKVYFPSSVDMSRFTADEQWGISNKVLFYLAAGDTLCILNQKEQTAYFIDMDGHLLSQRPVPGFLDYKVMYGKLGGENLTIHSSSSFYEGFFVHEGDIVGNYFASEREPSGKDESDTGYIQLIGPNGDYREMINPGGRYYLLHGNGETFYLLNQATYEIRPFKITALKQLPTRKPGRK